MQQLIMETQPQNSIAPFSGKRVHFVAVTDMKEDVSEIRWDIKHFKERLRNRDPEFRMLSPTFTFGEEPNQLQWQLLSRWNIKQRLARRSEHNVELLGIYLFLVNVQKPTKAEYVISILDAEEKPWIERSSEYEFVLPVQGRGFDLAAVASLKDPSNRLMEDDTLKIHCRIVMKRDVEYFMPGKLKEREQRIRKRDHCLVSDYTALFNSGTLSDFSIHTKKTTVQAHKAVLACRSPVFSAMFQNHMSESISNEVKIDDFEAEIVKAMVEYIYCGELPEEFLKERASELLRVAEKYEVRGLKVEAEDTIVENLCIENAAESLILADMNHSFGLKRKAMEFLNANRKEVMETEGFRKMLSYNPSLFKDLYVSQ